MLDALPNRFHPATKMAIHAIYLAEKRVDAVDRVTDFTTEFKTSQSGRKGHRYLDTLAGVLRLPSEHWKRLCSTNPIESIFASVSLSSKVTDGSSSQRAALALAHKLHDAAQRPWQRIDAASLVRAEAAPTNGHPQERNPTHQPDPEDVAT